MWSAAAALENPDRLLSYSAFTATLHIINHTDYSPQISNMHIHIRRWMERCRPTLSVLGVGRVRKQISSLVSR